MPKSQTSLSGKKAPKGYYYEISEDKKSSRLVREPKESKNVKIGRTAYGRKKGETKKEATKRILGTGAKYIAGRGRVLAADKPVQEGKLKGQFVKTLGTLTPAQAKEEDISLVKLAETIKKDPTRFENAKKILMGEEYE